MPTLYYRFKGVPEERPGGPWWHREFDSQGALSTHLEVVKPFLEDHAVEADHDCDNEYFPFSCPHHYPATRPERSA